MLHDGSLARAWHIGTRYHFGDTYNAMIEMGAVKPRIYPATHDGTRDGKPVFLSEAVWEDKKRKQTSSVLAAQMLQNPAAGNNAIFNKDWLKFSDIRPATLNVYILCDPASSKKKGSDRTAIPVIGIDAAGNRWLLDGYHHRMSLSERYAAIKGLRKVWMAMPGVQLVDSGSAVARRVQNVLGRVGTDAGEESWAYCTRLDTAALSLLPILQTQGLNHLIEWSN